MATALESLSNESAIFIAVVTAIRTTKSAKLRLDVQKAASFLMKYYVFG